MMLVRASVISSSGLLLLAASACGSSNDAPPKATLSSDAGAVTADAGTGDGGPVSGCGGSTIQAGMFKLTYKGVSYGYIVHLPPSYDPKTPMPLVLNWHGYTSNAGGQELFSRMDPVADKKGFIVVYPNSPDHSWNAGTCCGGAGRDDSGFAIALVHKIESAACIDSKRVYSTGMSNGAFMSYRLGCEHADVFAAIAPVAGKVGIPNCAPSRPVPLMAFHGTADSLVSYDTGALSADMLSVPDTVKAWAMRDTCTQGPDQTYQMGTVTCQTWSSCAGGATVTLCTAQGEDHCWPGNTFCPYTTMGTATADIDATSQIADFFAKFSLP